MFWTAECSLLRAEGFFCSMGVLYRGQTNPIIVKMALNRKKRKEQLNQSIAHLNQPIACNQRNRFWPPRWTERSASCPPLGGGPAAPARRSQSWRERGPRPGGSSPSTSWGPGRPGWTRSRLQFKRRGFLSTTILCVKPVRNEKISLANSFLDPNPVDPQ